MAVRPQSSLQRRGEPHSRRTGLRFPPCLPHSPPGPRPLGSHSLPPTPPLHLVQAAGMTWPRPPSPWGSRRPSCSFPSHSAYQPSLWRPHRQNPSVAHEAPHRRPLPARASAGATAALSSAHRNFSQFPGGAALWPFTRLFLLSCLSSTKTSLPLVSFPGPPDQVRGPPWAPTAPHSQCQNISSDGRAMAGSVLSFIPHVLPCTRAMPDECLAFNKYFWEISSCNTSP